MAWPEMGEGENEQQPLLSLARHWASSLERGEGQKALSGHEVHDSGPLRLVLSLGRGVGPFPGWYPSALIIPSKK